jgi:hypothetical protein
MDRQNVHRGESRGKERKKKQAERGDSISGTEGHWRIPKRERPNWILPHDCFHFLRENNPR